MRTQHGTLSIGDHTQGLSSKPYLTNDLTKQAMF